MDTEKLVFIEKEKKPNETNDDDGSRYTYVRMAHEREGRRGV